MTKPPVIFLSFANDQEGQFLEALRPEQTALHTELASYMADGKGLYHSAGSTEPIRLLHDLHTFRGRIIIFHYSGHANARGLQLESLNGEETFLHKGNLSKMLAEEPSKNLKLVFLNACNTNGLVQEFQNIGVPAIIATNATIPDIQAKEFSETFYRSLVAGYTLQTAFNQAKAVIEPELDKHRIHKGGIDFMAGQHEFPWGLFVQDDEILDWTLKDYLESDATTNAERSKRAEEERLKNKLNELKKLQEPEIIKFKSIEKKVQDYQEKEKLKEQFYDEINQGNTDNLEEYEKLERIISILKNGYEENRRKYESLQQEIKNLEADIIQVENDLKELQAGSNKELLKDGLLLLNYKKQEQAYNDYTGYAPNDLNLIWVKGEAEHDESCRLYEINMLIKILVKEWASVHSVSNPIHLDFGASASVIPDKNNIWSLTDTALSDEPGLTDRSSWQQQDNEDIISKAFTKLFNRMKVEAVIIRWEKVMEDLTPADFFPIVNAFWSKLIQQFSQLPEKPKHPLFVFLIDEQGLGATESSLQKVQNAKIQDKQVFYPLPTIEAIGIEDIRDWTSSLRSVLNRNPAFLGGAQQKIHKHKFFVEEGKREPLFNVVYKICKVFDHPELTHTIIKSI